MVHMRIVECVPNFSEGRDQAVVKAIASEVTSHARLLDANSDPDHNRTVLTFVGSPEEAAEAAFLAVRKAAELIDMTRHKGEHPSMGATDVVPFVPVSGVTMEDCAAIARSVGKRIGDELRIPIYLYESACSCPGRKHLESVRCNYETMRREIKSGRRKPDFGPAEAGKAGATVVGARDFLIAFNVNLATTDASAAKAIAAKVREANGGLLCLKALGFSLKSRSCVQVSMNLTDYRTTGLEAAFAAVEKEAKAAGVGILNSELVGLAPKAALEGVDTKRLRLALGPDKILENRL
jgi:glutamate formiminotransferase